MSKFQRARSAQQKQERINQIIKASEALYLEKNYMEISFLDIAKKLDFTRANLYKYYNSKDEIFLDIFGNDLVLWKDGLVTELKAKEHIHVDDFACIWSKHIIKNKRMLELLCILHTVIEKNVCVEKLAEFKKLMFRVYSEISMELLRLFPELSKQNLQMFYDFQMRYAVGLYPAVNKNEVQLEATRLSGVSIPKEEFEPTYSKFISIVLQGILDANVHSN